MPVPLLPRLWLPALLLFGLIAVAAMLQVDAQGLSWLGQRLPSVCLWQSENDGCPGCGTTRAGVLLLQGQIWQSLQMQPALPLFLGAAWFSWRRPSPSRRRIALGLAIAGLALASGPLVLAIL